MSRENMFPDPLRKTHDMYEKLWNIFRKEYYGAILYFPPEHDRHPDTLSMGYVSYVMDKRKEEWANVMMEEDYKRIWWGFLRRYGEGIIYPDAKLEGKPLGTVKDLMNKIANPYKE